MKALIKALFLSLLMLPSFWANAQTPSQLTMEIEGIKVEFSNRRIADLEARVKELESSSRK